MRNLLQRLGTLSLLSLVVASGSCKREPPSEAPPPAVSPLAVSPPAVPPPATQPTNPPGNNPPGKGTIVVTNAPNASVFSTVDALTALPQLSKAALEQFFGVSMTHVPDAQPAQQYYEADLPSGVFSRVEVREANPSQAKFELVMLEARPNAGLNIDGLRAAGRIPPNTAPRVNPNVPPEGTATYTFRSGSQAVHYEFMAESEKLASVMIERRPAP